MLSLTTTRVLIAHSTTLHITAYVLKFWFKAFSSQAFQLQCPRTVLTRERWDDTNPWSWEQAETTGRAAAPVLAMDLAAKASQPRGAHRILEFILHAKFFFFFSYLEDKMDLFLVQGQGGVADHQVKATHQRRTGVAPEQNTSSLGQMPHISFLRSYCSCKNKAQARNKAILFRRVKKSTYVSSVLRSLLPHHEEKFCLISDRTHGPLYSMRDRIQNSPCVFVIWNKTNKHNFYSVDMNIWKMTSTWLQL